MSFVALCLWTLVATFSLTGSQHVLLDDGAPNGDSPSSRKEPRRGAVASENKICSRIGTDLLEAGGNAADAVGFLKSVGLGGLAQTAVSWKAVG